MTFRDCTGKHQLLSSTHLVEKIGKRALGFEYQEGAFVGNVWMQFLPKGLIIWGAPDGSTLSQAIITNANYMIASHLLCQAVSQRVKEAHQFAGRIAGRT